MEDPIVSWSQFRQVPMNFRRSSKVDIEVHSVVNFSRQLVSCFLHCLTSHCSADARGAAFQGHSPTVKQGTHNRFHSRTLRTGCKASKTPAQATMLGLCYEVLKMGLLLQHLEESRRDAKRIWGKASHWDLACSVMFLLFSGGNL